MKKALLIVESPNKIKTLQRILGNEYLIKASIGHVKNLPKNSLAVDIENSFEPEYIIIMGRKKIIKELQEVRRKCDKVLLSPDPDREGEAISWHLAEELNIPPTSKCRVTFNAITEKVVKEALKSPRPIDMNLVNAQKARRVLDRLVGYLFSPILWEKIMMGLSTGRVQSVALMFICDREKEINNFIKEEYWELKGYFKTNKGKEFSAKLSKINDAPPQIKSKESVAKILNEIKLSPLIVRKINRKKVLRDPGPPLITSTLQQEAYNKYKFSAKKTMRIAQSLYEGVNIKGKGQVALITYIRTDSVRVDDSACEDARNYILKNFGKDYLPPKKRVFQKKGKSKVQDAHEAIRPVYLDLTPDIVANSLTKDEFKLYDLIFRRFIASQCTSAEIEKLEIILSIKEFDFKIATEHILFPGFLILMPKANSAEKIKEIDILKNLTENEKVMPVRYEPLQKFTEPPSRYTEATLVKTLEKKGIGRPSTYATIVSTLSDRNYVIKTGGKFFATDLGMLVAAFIKKYFSSFINVDFTAEMEEKLDAISEGKLSYTELLSYFYKKITEVRASVDKTKPKLEIKTDVTCPLCKKEMLLKFSKNGKFLYCSAFPECKGKISLMNTTNFLSKGVELDKKLKIKNLLPKCEKCGKIMVTKKGKFGFFLACSGFPACKNTNPIVESLDIPCPEKGCNGMVVQKLTKKGKVFYGCSNYPDCTYASWKKPGRKEQVS